MNDMNVSQPIGTEIIVIPEHSALAVFTEMGAIDPLLARIRAEIDAFEPDLSTAASRKAIASIAYKVAQSKARIDDAGKLLVAKQKEIPNKIDATRRRVRDTLDAWRDEVRKPLTDWEAVEADRVSRHNEVLAWFAEMAKADPMVQSAGELSESLDTVRGVVIGEHCQEFITDYARGRDAAIVGLERAIAARNKHEAEQAELARLRKAEAVRMQQEREAQIARDAAEHATRMAETKAAAERAIADVASQRALDHARAREVALSRENDASKRRAIEAEAAAKTSVSAEAARSEAETAAREADRSHRAAVHRAALSAFVELGITEPTARRVIELIGTCKIPHIIIAY
jgi:hypothetical protein